MLSSLRAVGPTVGANLVNQAVVAVSQLIVIPLLIGKWGLEEYDAMRNEMRLGLQTIASGEAEAGAAAFSSGAGRHGKERGDDGER